MRASIANGRALLWLLAGVGPWNSWRPRKRIDLSGVSLVGVDLTGYDLRGVNFEGADLRRTTLRGARLDRSLLSGADLGRAISLGRRFHKRSYSLVIALERCLISLI